VRAQGLINFLNSSGTLITISSNGYPAVAMPGGQPGTYRFELFIAPAGTLNPASFTATGLIATNLAAAGRLNGGTQLHVPGVALGGTAAILVRGWSANLGSNYASALVAWQNFEPGYLGESSIAPNFLFGGDGGNGTVPTSPAFGGASGIQSGFVLSTMCLSYFYPPWFLQNPSDAFVRLGNDVILSASAFSCRGLWYQWWKETGPITGATYSFLTLTNVTLSDSGYYYVVASNPNGSRASSSARLTVFLPVIAATLGSPTYTTNNQFQFTVTGTVGTDYVVQVSTNLATADWVSLLTNAAPYTFVETNAHGFPHRFYRAYTP
jgi:hypothetical protein